MLVLTRREGEGLLRALDKRFNGQPDELKSALGIMYELKLAAAKVVRHPLNKKYVATPPFMDKPEG